MLTHILGCLAKGDLLKGKNADPDLHGCLLNRFRCIDLRVNHCALDTFVLVLVLALILVLVLTLILALILAPLALGISVAAALSSASMAAALSSAAVTAALLGMAPI